MRYLFAYLLLPGVVLLIRDIRSPKSPKSNLSDKIVRRVVILVLLIIISVLIFIVLFPLLNICFEYLFIREKNTNIPLFLSMLIAIAIAFNCILRNFIGYLDPIEKFFIEVVMTAFIILCLLTFGFSDKIAILYFTHSIEISENSSWYLLHNNFQQNNGFQETNGINKSDLKALKKRFNSNLCTEKGLKEHTLQYYSTPASRENALYGYMAWNLGDTKVFCPPTVDNTKADFTKTNECSKTPNECRKTEEQEEAEKLTKECIVISGKALQIMPEGYISTEPIQQPRYDL